MDRLPKEFAALETLVAEWVLPDSRARAEKRLASSYAELKAFYDTMLEYAPQALRSLANQQLGELHPPQENLLKLLLALAEIGPAVEWYGQPAVVDGFAAKRFQLIEQIPDCTAQEKS